MTFQDYLLQLTRHVHCSQLWLTRRMKMNIQRPSMRCIYLHHARRIQTVSDFKLASQQNLAEPTVYKATLPWQQNLPVYVKEFSTRQSVHLFPLVCLIFPTNSSIKIRFPLQWMQKQVNLKLFSWEDLIRYDPSFSSSSYLSQYHPYYPYYTWQQVMPYSVRFTNHRHLPSIISQFFLPWK